MEQYLGLVGLALVLFYVFSDGQETVNIINSLSEANVGGIEALQGRSSGFRSF